MQHLGKEGEFPVAPSLATDVEDLIFKVDVFHVDGDRLSDTEPQAIEQSVEEKVPEAEDAFCVNGTKQFCNLSGFQGFDGTAIRGSCSGEALDGELMGALHLRESQESQVTSDGAFLAVDGARLVSPVMVEPGEKAQDSLSCDLVPGMVVEIAGEEVEIALVGLDARGLVIERSEAKGFIRWAQPVKIGQSD